MQNQLPPPVGNPNPTIHRIHTVILWSTAVVLALFINIMLFGLMPGLTDRSPQLPDYSPPVEKINVIRIKKPEPSLQPPKPKEPAKPRTPPQKQVFNKQVYRNPPPRPKFHLPFEINPRLPVISRDFQVPPMETVPIGLPGLGTPGLKSMYGVGEIDHPLTALARTPPIYPMRARRRGIEGWVKVRFIVTTEGRVTDIKISESRPEKIFDASVIRCVSAWRFSPGTVEGLAVKTWMETTVVFVLQN